MDKGESEDVENVPKTSLSSGTTACALPAGKTNHPDVTTTQDMLTLKGDQVTLPFSHVPEVPSVTLEPKVQYPLSSGVNTNQLSTKTDTTSQDISIDVPESDKSPVLGSTANILDCEAIFQLATSEHDISNQFVSKGKDSPRLDGHVADDASMVTTESPMSVAPCPTFDLDQTISREEMKRLAKIGRRKRAKVSEQNGLKLEARTRLT